MNAERMRGSRSSHAQHGNDNLANFRTVVVSIPVYHPLYALDGFANDRDCSKIVQLTLCVGLQIHWGQSYDSAGEFVKCSHRSTWLSSRFTGGS